MLQIHRLNAVFYRFFSSSKVFVLCTKSSFPNERIKKDHRHFHECSAIEKLCRSPYPICFSYLQGKIKNIECVKALEQMDHEKYRLKDKDKPLVVTKEKRSCSLQDQINASLLVNFRDFYRVNHFHIELPSPLPHPFIKFVKDNFLPNLTTFFSE